MAASSRMWAFNSPACGACSSMAWKVHRKTTTLMTISDSVMIGHRRADIFSCPIGISIHDSFLQELGGVLDILKSLSRFLAALLKNKRLQSTEVTVHRVITIQTESI